MKLDFDLTTEKAWDVVRRYRKGMYYKVFYMPLMANTAQDLTVKGIELLPDGGEVHVSGKKQGRELLIAMSNPVASKSERSKRGNKMAMSNIRQRFELAYGGRASVDVNDASDRFTVSLRFPLEEGEA